MGDADLGLVPRAELCALAEHLLIGRTIEHLIIPQRGLWLMEMTEPVHGDHYFLGEVPAAQACVEVRDPALGAVKGGAVLLQADREQAVAAAVCDAVRRAGWPGTDDVEALLARGAAHRAIAESARQAILDRTRVDFRELSQEGG